MAHLSFVVPHLLPRIKSCSRLKHDNVRMCAAAKDAAAIATAVESLYDTYPFPPEPLIDSEPLGYNWRHHYPSSYQFCYSRSPPKEESRERIRILDAGAGSGAGTEYIVHLNPNAEVVALDLSAEALKVAEERIRRSCGVKSLERTKFVHKSLFDVKDLKGNFDYIVCVGVVHHTPDPGRALRLLGEKLKDGGFIHVFVYAKHGRWEISLMQQALRLLRKNSKVTSFEDGVRIGRAVFDALPDGNRLKLREEQRWAQDNMKDATFADMYVHPQEIDYDIPSIFKLVEESGLEFLGFSNPRNFKLDRLLGSNLELMEMTKILNEQDRLRLVELLDPESVTHFEFYLGKPPLKPKCTWNSDEDLQKASATLSPCITGWPGKIIFDRDYVPFQLSDEMQSLMKYIDERTKDGDVARVGEAAFATKASLDVVRDLSTRGVLFLDL